jgi:hypothetical protein
MSERPRVNDDGIAPAARTVNGLNEFSLVIALKSSTSQPNSLAIERVRET